MTAEVHGIIPEFSKGDRLRLARQLTGLTTRAFAEEIGVSQKTITDAEGDRVRPRRITIIAYAMRTGVSRHWLETGQAPPELGGPADLASYTARDSNSEPIDLESPRVLTLVAA